MSNVYELVKRNHCPCGWEAPNNIILEGAYGRYAVLKFQCPKCGLWFQKDSKEPDTSNPPRAREEEE